MRPADPGEPGDRSEPAPVRVGITGHIDLTTATAELVYQELLGYLRSFTDRPVTGVTCLAGGTDQLFARAVLAAGGRYEVILPARDYRDRALRPEHRPAFDELLSRAIAVCYTDIPRSGSAAYSAASATMLSRSQYLVAVWDGTSVGGPGGTEDVLRQARRQGLAVTIIWPPGATRESAG